MTESDLRYKTYVTTILERRIYVRPRVFLSRASNGAGLAADCHSPSSEAMSRVRSMVLPLRLPAAPPFQALLPASASQNHLNGLPRGGRAENGFGRFHPFGLLVN